MSKDELLQETLSILNNGATWCQGANARDDNDKPCAILSEKATQWDIFGALLKANLNQETFKEYHEVYQHLRENIPESYKNQDIESYNDDVNWSSLTQLFN